MWFNLDPKWTILEGGPWRNPQFCSLWITLMFQKIFLPITSTSEPPNGHQIAARAAIQAGKANWVMRLVCERSADRIPGETPLLLPLFRRRWTGVRVKLMHNIVGKTIHFELYMFSLLVSYHWTVPFLNKVLTLKHYTCLLKWFITVDLKHVKMTKDAYPCDELHSQCMHGISHLVSLAGLQILSRHRVFQFNQLSR